MRYPALCAGIFLAAAAGLGVPAALAAGEAPDRGPAGSAPAQSAESIQAPALIGPPALLPPYGPLELLTLDSQDPLDRGSDFTDAGLGAPPAAPTALEQTKLDMARAAIEASRAAGTLYSLGPQPADPGDLDALRAAKLDRLRTQAPAAGPEQAGPSGVGGGLEPIQLIGPAEPTAAELAKLQESYPATPNPAAAARPATPATSSTAGDPDPSQAQEEVQR